ncbi:MAG: putative 7-cyano-7-deazaguanine synthase [Prokaryotic dsDNA virus sp.]|nr:MAG: putative 7-cyano-7-deazaguanine synthase [Prokaryotic dsDNA virus sp.]|tara:strand:+ start:1322 stop:1990 length:669 start_codon:yes stop_codon:yes gene_type:complete
MKAVVIFSGGQDSTTCLYWALKQKYRFDEVEAITFDYGQKHSIEIEQSKIICKKENIKQTIIDISFLDTIVESALTSNGNVNQLNEKGLPASFVPNRNQLFITMAHSYAQKVGAKVLVGGMCETDFSGYPDCRREFIDSIQLSSNIGSDSDIKIETPLMYLDKAETFKMANDIGHLKEIIELSHTCYNGDRTMNEWGAGCGNCPACELRKKGYYEAKEKGWL